MEHDNHILFASNVLQFWHAVFLQREKSTQIVDSSRWDFESNLLLKRMQTAFI